MIDESIMSSETRKKACSCEAKGENGREGRYRTYELDAPSEHSSLEVLVVRQRGPLDDLSGVDDGHPAVQLATGDVVVEVLPSG